MVEMIVDRRMDRREFLKCFTTSEFQQGPFSSPEWLMGVFSPIVKAPARCLAGFIATLFHGRPIGSRFICRYDLAFVIDGAPEIVSFSIYSDEYLVQMQRHCD